MFEVPVLLVLIVVVALIFDFTNGAHDCANAIATVVSTKVLSPRTAVIMAATLNLIGAFLGTKVANTLGSGIVHPDIVANCQPLVLAALIGAIGWNLFTWHFGIPSSCSYAQSAYGTSSIRRSRGFRCSRRRSWRPATV